MYFKHYFVFAGFSALSPLKEIRPFVPLLFFHGALLFFPTGIHQSGFHQRKFPITKQPTTTKSFHGLTVESPPGYTAPL
jgi:hypothetical protein